MQDRSGAFSDGGRTRNLYIARLRRTGFIDPHAPSVKEKVRDIISAMDTPSYFNAMAMSMAINPPVLPQDAPIVAEMAKIGLVPGQPLDLSKLPPADQTALADVGKVATEQIDGQQKTGNKVVNGRRMTSGTGDYGTNYLWRAAVANVGWGANLIKDAIYPSTKSDSDGSPLEGTNTYVIHFAEGQAPPASGFWSITMYDGDYYFYPNPLNKLTVSMRDKPVANADRPLFLARQTGEGASGQLAARAGGAVHPDDAYLLALGETSVETGRHLVATISHEGSTDLTRRRSKALASRVKHGAEPFHEAASYRRD